MTDETAVPQLVDSEQNGFADETTPDEYEHVPEEQPTTAKPSVKKHSAIEYNLEDMYPEIGILISKSRHQWNYNDPDIIRAIWLESKTNVLQEWKIRHGKIDKSKNPEITLNHTAQLRLEHQKQKEEQRKIEFRQYHRMLALGKIAPRFNTVKMATTTTAEMRHKFNRNNPPIPGYYINHYDKYKKPPFKTKKLGRGCLPDEMSR